MRCKCIQDRSTVRIVQPERVIEIPKTLHVRTHEVRFSFAVGHTRTGQHEPGDAARHGIIARPCQLPKSTGDGR
jgi:hypothetical protein